MIGGFDTLPCVRCADERPCDCGEGACQCSCGRCLCPVPLDDDGPDDHA
jgi:hypothetical protein